MNNFFIKKYIPYNLSILNNNKFKNINVIDILNESNKTNNDIISNILQPKIYNEDFDNEDFNDEYFDIDAHIDQTIDSDTANQNIMLSQNINSNLANQNIILSQIIDSDIANQNIIPLYNNNKIIFEARDEPLILYQIDALNHDEIFNSMYDLLEYIKLNSEFIDPHYVFPLIKNNKKITIKMQKFKTILNYLLENHIKFKLK